MISFILNGRIKVFPLFVCLFVCSLMFITSNHVLAFYLSKAYVRRLHRSHPEATASSPNELGLTSNINTIILSVRRSVFSYDSSLTLRSCFRRNSPKNTSTEFTSAWMKKRTVPKVPDGGNGKNFNQEWLSKRWRSRDTSDENTGQVDGKASITWRSMWRKWREKPTTGVRITQNLPQELICADDEDINFLQVPSKYCIAHNVTQKLLCYNRSFLYTLALPLPNSTIESRGKVVYATSLYLLPNNVPCGSSQRDRVPWHKHPAGTSNVVGNSVNLFIQINLYNINKCTYAVS